MKNLISKTVIILALTIPAITVLAATTGFTTTNNETVINHPNFIRPGVDENSSSILNYLKTETVADTLTTNTERKGWDGSVKGNSKGINEAGIKRTENQRKGWDGTVKGGNMQEESIGGMRNPGDNMQQKANINTSRSNIKRGMRNPGDSMQQKANINTSRSNIKRGIRMPADSLQQTEADGMSNPYYKSNTNAGEMPAQLQRGIDKKDIRRGVRENADVYETTETLNGSSNPTNQPQHKTKHETAKNSVGNIR